MLRAATRARRARPAPVAWATARVFLARSRLAAGSVMWTSCKAESGANRTLNAKTESRAWFQIATAPPTTPQPGRAPSSRPGMRWTSPAVTMPPSESPQAMVWRGRPTLASNSSSTAVWSARASLTAQPVDAYDDPARAKPWSSSQPPVTGSLTSWAGLGLPGAR
ncbi:MAG TPA: hypothetical protein VFJ69_01670 [Actinomycetota bacterium]|nr:hypothetical protein [Actinomycetota bacterium]